MYNNDFVGYSKKVVRHIGVNKRLSNKIREDIMMTLENKSEELRINDPYELMGNPKDVAEEFRVNMELPKKDYFEYISDKEIFGIPLIHINNKRNGVAKGIISIGAISFGVISLGGISFGIFSLGGFSLGLLLSLGGFSVSPLGIALGGFAAGYSLALGGFAKAKGLAIGGFASADIALGDTIKATVGAYKTSGVGENIFDIFTDGKEKLIPAIKDMYPNISKIKIWIIEKFMNGMI